MTTQPISITLPAKLLKAAMYFQAELDVRYYLNGIYLDKEGFIVATNGHTLFRAECEQVKDLSESMIVQIESAISAKALWADFSIEPGDKFGSISYRDSLGKAVTKSKRSGFPLRNQFSLIDGKYPNLNKVIPKGRPRAVTGIGINPSYMHKVAQASKAVNAPGGAELLFRGKQKTIQVSLTAHPEILILIMPMTIPESNVIAA